MKNLNTLSKSDFVGDTVFYGVCLAIIYRFACFSSIYGITVVSAKIIFWMLVVFLIPLGIYITYTNRRNYISILVNIMLPFEIYTVISTFRYIPTVNIIVLIVAAIFSAVYFSMIVFRKIKRKKHLKKIIYNRIKSASLGTRVIIAVVLFVVTLPVCVKSALGYELISSDVAANIDDATDDEWSLSNNIDTVALLHENTWNNLSLSDKLNVLGTVKNIEMRYFGINHEVYLDAGNLEGDTIGCYNDKEHKITIDIEHLKSSDSQEILNTLLHECRHVYDRMCVELYNQIDDDYKNMLMFYEISEFRDDFNNYTDGDEDPLGYYFQSVEISAREYSEIATIEYFECINKYLQQSYNSNTEE